MVGRACQDTNAKMSGTTLCPHCGIRFKVSRSQLEAHQGMVRCGHCLQAFDTHPNFAPEEIDPQLVLPILNKTEIPESLPSTEWSEPIIPNHIDTQDLQAPVPDEPVDNVLETDNTTFLSKPHSRLWTVAAFLLSLSLIAQTIYLFRVELAARFPELKPALIHSCKLLKCTVPLPRNITLLSIESSELKDDPAQRSNVFLYALLRNRAAYAQTFPSLELTLTNIQDQVIARRTFKPRDYLPASENETSGFPANMEVSVTLHLNTTDLKPVGYRLVLLY